MRTGGDGRYHCQFVKQTASDVLCGDFEKNKFLIIFNDLGWRNDLYEVVDLDQIYNFVAEIILALKYALQVSDLFQ